MDNYKQKYFIVDYKFGEEPVKTRIYDWNNQQSEAEQFCAKVKEQGGAVNIRIRTLEIPA